eukprot:CAMPEP_0180830914 /NCGR_PEP_ID=MMETSP1038_2-20121128/76061_1 /TAXON_ID=632150 /ORGANISM="Azadinium spinosum, Strain 3D9" /LENGTH=105 /DNA_ID=CAMNT_0022874081 /DNA_START=205 /DNA_END=520 /DNA_ORIENTATION=-
MSASEIVPTAPARASVPIGELQTEPAPQAPPTAAPTSTAPTVPTPPTVLVTTERPAGATTRPMAAATLRAAKPTQQDSARLDGAGGFQAAFTSGATPTREHIVVH